jgi:hypothetical protein
MGTLMNAKHQPIHFGQHGSLKVASNSKQWHVTRTSSLGFEQNHLQFEVSNFPDHVELFLRTLSLALAQKASGSKQLGSAAVFNSGGHLDPCLEVVAGYKQVGRPSHT